MNPANGEVYLTLTNNSSRTVANTDAANPRAYTDPKTSGGATNGNGWDNREGVGEQTAQRAAQSRG